MATTLRAGAGRTELAASRAEIDAARALSSMSLDELPSGLVVPDELRNLIGEVIASVARGETVTVGTLPDELSTSVAAEQLGISRPTLMRLVSNGEIPSHKVGTHTRLRTEDVISFRRQRVERQRKAFEDLRAFEDGLGI